MTVQLPEAPAAPTLPAGVALAQAQVDAAASTRSKVTVQTQAQVAALLQSFTGWYDDRAVASLGQQIARVVQAGQQMAAAAQNAYMSWVLSSQTGKTVQPVGQVPVGNLREGVTAPNVYARLGEQYRYSRSLSDATPETALQATVSRADVMVDTDVALASRKQASANLKASRDVVGYRRVIHPEVSKGGTCGMCLVASDRIYHKADLMPLHARCACEVMPVTRHDDPGSALNNLSLADLYDQAKGDQIFDLVRTRYTVEHHDQLGPQLVPAKTPASSWHAGASPEQLAALRHAVQQREGNDKVRRNMDTRLRRMQKAAEREARQQQRAAK